MTERPPVIFVDSKIPFGFDAFSTIGEVVLFDAKKVSPGIFRQANVIVVRSVTRVDAELLSNAPHLIAIASATIGLDHVDQAALESYRRLYRRLVPLFYAPGSTAAGVGDYSAAAIFAMLGDLDLQPRDVTVGIWGYGNCGRALHDRLSRFGCRVVAYDPPLEERSNGAFKSASLNDLLSCKVLSLHVPLTTPDQSKWPTFGMVDEKVFESCPDTGWPRVFINTARGAIVNTPAIKKAIGDGRVLAALDVFENEPEPDQELVSICRIATPHVAGYVKEGRVRATAMIRQALADFLNMRTQWICPDVGQRPSLKAFSYSPKGVIELVQIESLSTLFRHQYVNADPCARATIFETIRAQAMRHEIDWM